MEAVAVALAVAVAAAAAVPVSYLHPARQLLHGLGLDCTHRPRAPTPALAQARADDQQLADEGQAADMELAVALGLDCG